MIKQDTHNPFSVGGTKAQTRHLGPECYDLKRTSVRSGPMYFLPPISAFACCPELTEEELRELSRPQGPITHHSTPSRGGLYSRISTSHRDRVYCMYIRASSLFSLLALLFRKATNDTTLSCPPDRKDWLLSFFRIHTTSLWRGSRLNPELFMSYSEP